MKNVYLISDEYVRQNLKLSDVINGVEKAYCLKSLGKAGLFPVITHEWLKGSKDMDIKSGYIDGDIQIYGLKALTYIESNDDQGFPRLNGVMMLFNSENGQLLGIIDSRSITGIRTGAAGAIGSKYLARPQSETLLLVGSGNQALNNLAANLITMKCLKKVLVFDPKSPQLAKDFSERAKVQLAAGLLRDEKQILERIEIKTIDNLEAGCSTADIITTVTPSLSPLVMKDWVKEGTHINCIGADMEGKQELDDALLPAAKVVVDDKMQSTTIGELEKGIKKGTYRATNIYCEIGDIVNGNVPGRTNDEEITVFDTTGLALQDLIVAKILIDTAKSQGLATVTV